MRLRPDPYDLPEPTRPAGGQDPLLVRATEQEAGAVGEERWQVRACAGCGVLVQGWARIGRPEWKAPKYCPDCTPPTTE